MNYVEKVISWLDEKKLDSINIRNFSEKVEVLPNECWRWLGGLREGYGAITIYGKRCGVHRITYEHFIGPIQDGLVLDHLCLNKWCCNPKHLEQVTAGENTRRALLGKIFIHKKKLFDKYSFEFIFKLLSNINLSYNKRRNLSKLIIINQETGCWEWQGTIRKGYGRYKSKDRKNVAAHRYIFEILVKKIKDGMIIDHVCRVRNCVNPDHLREVTPRINALENTISIAAMNTNKTKCQNGHIFNNDNTKYTKAGRICKKCNKEWYKKYSEKLKAAKQKPKKKTHCKYGHELTDDNIYIYNKTKTCKQCSLLRSKKQRDTFNEINPKIPKTTCKNGHPFTIENTKYRKNGTRYCLACAKRLWTIVNEKKKEQNKLNGKSLADRKGKRLKTHCPKGHEYSDENSMLMTNGGRMCRICSIEYQKDRRINSVKYSNYSMQNGRLRKKFCPKGHEFTEENIYYRYEKKDNSTTRCCKQCNRDRANANHLKRKYKDNLAANE